MPRIPDDAPELTDKERQRIDAIAAAAAKKAQAAKAMSYLPFPELAQGPRLVAAWLSSLGDLSNFYGSEVKSANTSVQVFRVVRGSEMTAGTCFGRNFDEFVKSLTKAFCSNRESDEVDELIAIKWILRVPTTRPSATIQPRSRFRRVAPVAGEYVNQAKRGTKKETPDQVAINAAEAQGGKVAKKIHEVYDATFAMVWEREEANIKADARRNRRVAAEIAKQEAKAERRSARKK